MRRSLAAPVLACAAALASLLVLPAPARADDLDQEAAAREVKSLLAKAPPEDVPALWILSRRLAEAGKSAIPALRESLAGASPGARLALGRALDLLGDDTKALEAL